MERLSRVDGRPSVLREGSLIGMKRLSRVDGRLSALDEGFLIAKGAAAHVEKGLLPWQGALSRVVAAGFHSESAVTPAC